MYYPLTTNPAQNVQIMNRFMRENLATSSPALPGLRRPFPPRGIFIVWNAPNFTISWVGPSNMSGVVGFNIYQNSEKNRIQNLANPSNLSTSVAMPTGFTGPAGFYMSCYTALLESVIVPIVGTAT